VSALEAGAANALEAMGEQLGLSMSTFRTAFALMDVAEEVLAKHGLSRARTARDVSLFWVARPNELVQVNPELYRLHADELCVRFKAGERLDLGTRAECIRALMQTSLKAPLNSDGMAALNTLVQGTFLASCFADLGIRERWPGQAEELISEIRRKLTTDREEK